MYKYWMLWNTKLVKILSLLVKEYDYMEYSYSYSKIIYNVINENIFQVHNKFSLILLLHLNSANSKRLQLWQFWEKYLKFFLKEQYIILFSCQKRKILCLFITSRESKHKKLFCGSWECTQLSTLHPSGLSPSSCLFPYIKGTVWQTPRWTIFFFHS